MSKFHFIAFTCVLTLLGSALGARAADYNCPAPKLVKCVPADKTISGWQDNGGQKTGNTFAPNNQCANLIDLPDGKKRLVCCYTHCGVFLQDVQAAHCVKQSQSHFVCN